MSLKHLLPCVILWFAALVPAPAQDRATSAITIRTDHAFATLVTRRAPSGAALPAISDAGLVTIFNSLAASYPKGRYWCCMGYNVMGPNSGLGVQWMAAPFTPAADRTVTRIAVAAGYSQQGANGVVVSLNDDNNGVPGQALQSWNTTGLPRFGSCCAVVVESNSTGIPVTAGKQYWVVLSTNSSESDTVDGWNVEDTDQVDPATMASYAGTQWTVFQATPGLGFAVLGK